MHSKSNFKNSTTQATMDSDLFQPSKNPSPKAKGLKSSNEIPIRRMMRCLIMKRLRLMCIEKARLGEIPLVATKIEKILFRSSRTKKEYIDPTTLDVRLRMVRESLYIQRIGKIPNKNL